MGQKYATGSITAGPTPQFIHTGFDVLGFSFYSSLGDYQIRLKTIDGWGGWIKCFKDISISENFECLGVEVKSIASVTVEYFIKGI